MVLAGISHNVRNKTSTSLFRSSPCHYTSPITEQQLPFLVSTFKSRGLEDEILRKVTDRMAETLVHETTHDF